MILLLPAEYTQLKMATTQAFNPFKTLLEQVEYAVLANSCGYGLDLERKSSIRCITDEMIRLRKENEELKSQRPRYTCPQDEDLTGGDANYQYYYAVDDGHMTIWKVPHHLAEVKSAKTSYHGAVEQSFYDECFGEEYGKLNYLIVREMKQAELIKRGWKPKVEEEATYCRCAECEKCPSHINPYEWAKAIHGEE